MYYLQDSVTVNDRTYTIRNRGDFRMVLDCFSALNDEELSEDFRVLASLLIFYNEFNDLSDFNNCQDDLEQLTKEMYKFFNCGQDNSPGANVDKPVLDWDKDSQMICSAVNKVANMEVRATEYLHWWTFMGYYAAVGESTLSTVVSIRHKLLHHKKLEKWEKDFKKENPNLFVWKSTTVADRAAEDAIRNLWNSGGG